MAKKCYGPTAERQAAGNLSPELIVRSLPRFPPTQASAPETVVRPVTEEKSEPCGRRQPAAKGWETVTKRRVPGKAAPSVQELCKLYAIEHHARAETASAEQRQSLRQEFSGPILITLKTRLEALRADNCPRANYPNSQRSGPSLGNGPDFYRAPARNMPHACSSIIRRETPKRQTEQTS